MPSLARLAPSLVFSAWLSCKEVIWLWWMSVLILIRTLLKPPTSPYVFVSLPSSYLGVYIVHLCSTWPQKSNTEYCGSCKGQSMPTHSDSMYCMASSDLQGPSQTPCILINPFQGCVNEIPVHVIPLLPPGQCYVLWFKSFNLKRLFGKIYNSIELYWMSLSEIIWFCFSKLVEIY